MKNKTIRMYVAIVGISAAALYMIGHSSHAGHEPSGSLPTIYSLEQRHEPARRAIKGCKGPDHEHSV